MVVQPTDGSLPAIHLPKETIEMAKRIQSVADVLKDDERGNGEITFKLKVCGGVISNILNFAATWFSGKKKDETLTSTPRGKRAKSK